MENSSTKCLSIDERLKRLKDECVEEDIAEEKALLNTQEVDMGESVRRKCFSAGKMHALAYSSPPRAVIHDLTSNYANSLIEQVLVMACDELEEKQIVCSSKLALLDIDKESIRETMIQNSKQFEGLMYEYIVALANKAAE
jgi:hypothetical protein